MVRGRGRAPSLATGVKRAKPNSLVFTIQGDGDMVNEGLQEVIHTAARGENVTCILLNNGVFGETGGHMTATSVLGPADGLAMIESTAIYCFVISMILIFGNPFWQHVIGQ